MMNKFRALLASIVALVTSCDSRIIEVPIKKENAMNIYINPLNDVHGNSIETNTFSGKVTLIVNLASKCGLTPQYKDLQVLHDRYIDQGFVVVGFPCNDFGGQEPGNADDITKCAAEYGASFPIMNKVSVLAGEDQCDIYRDLGKETGALPEWNFGKYLVDKHGTPIAFFGSMIEPLSEDITNRIELLLNINN